MKKITVELWVSSSEDKPTEEQSIENFEVIQKLITDDEFVCLYNSKQQFTFYL